MALATPQQRQRFVELLDTYLVDFYWSSLAQYHGQQLRILSERPIGSGVTLVATQLLRPGERPIQFDWTVVTRRNQDKTVDLSIDGVSQALTDRAQFTDLLARNGGSMSALIAQMQAQNSYLI